MNCPNCNSELQTEKRQGTDISQCGSCSGILLSEVNSLKIIPEVEQYAVLQEKSTDEVVLADSERDCPACDIKYKMLNYKDVELDFCPKCRGIWFDKNELESIKSYMEKCKNSVQEQSGSGSIGMASTLGDVGVNIVIGFVGEAVSCIFESLFD